MDGFIKLLDWLAAHAAGSALLVVVTGAAIVEIIEACKGGRGRPR